MWCLKSMKWKIHVVDEKSEAAEMIIKISVLVTRINEISLWTVTTVSCSFFVKKRFQTETWKQNCLN